MKSDIKQECISGNYKFIPGKIYRMPTHFGPTTGPRQGPDGKNFAKENKEWPKQTDWIVNFLSNEDQLAALCPEGFSPVGEPVVTVGLTDMKGIPWLAGRGYKMLGVSFNVLFEGKEDRAMGPFLTVLWENMADPILSGREEIGFSKIYCELPDPIEFNDTTRLEASWQGYKFFNMELTDMKPVSLDEIPVPPAVDPDVQLGMLHYKYMPRTGEWGKADVSYPVLTPADNPNVKVSEVFQGKGTISFKKARWEDMPTQYMIVNTLAELEIKEFRGALIRHYRGSKDLSDQRILQ
ncbi:acetoacetate decarboxylase family protein [Mangrovivirga sp. M17]|uniref:Acetoacetate decarboxylase family protein n=1 Tax=Mangrovivirga halotolerans TaxID=2993936 RepID=A0ABT3RQW2_9BACT|nr:acetoacetate decarboxylase family protein [Mangrovivirga halotolerans]MCX2744155.1 acetoacetate decarboxylase family protein [Mangrovivirga halotolerans]